MGRRRNEKSLSIVVSSFKLLELMNMNGGVQSVALLIGVRDTTINRWVGEGVVPPSKFYQLVEIFGEKVQDIVLKM